MVTEAQMIRLAVAFTALHHRSAEQSYQGTEYWSLNNFIAYTVTKPTGPTKFDDLAASWRARCDELEKELRELEHKLRDENAELVALRVAQCARDSNASPTPSNTVVKKKSKKRTKPPTPSASSTVHSHFSSSLETFVGETGDSGKLFSALHTLDRLIATRADKSTTSETETLFTATTRVLDALAQTFASLLPPKPAAISSIGVVSTISTILGRLLTVVLPAFAPKNGKATLCPTLNCYVDDLLGRILSSILLPALRSFVPLTRLHLNTLFRPSTKKRPPASTTGSLKPFNDLRPAVYTLLRTTLTHLQQLAPANSASTSTSRATLQPIIRAVQSSLALSATRELEALYTPNSARPSAVGVTAASTPRCPDRAEKLVRADALWYICGVLNLTLPGTAGEGEQGANANVGRLLQEGVCAALAGVLRRVHDGGHATREGEGDRGREVESAGENETSGMRMSVVEREMVMAVAEAVWLSQG
ncbi:hypothetical protein EIP86_009026 [Pleurotus ostreatoroseus]|nr:hypothetical protein EIP86_009026 [Pleurotus ostreatoroseus]